MKAAGVTAASARGLQWSFVVDFGSHRCQMGSSENVVKKKTYVPLNTSTNAYFGGYGMIKYDEPIDLGFGIHHCQRQIYSLMNHWWIDDVKLRWIIDSSLIDHRWIMDHPGNLPRAAAAEHFGGHNGSTVASPGLAESLVGLAGHCLDTGHLAKRWTRVDMGNLVGSWASNPIIRSYETPQKSMVRNVEILYIHHGFVWGVLNMNGEGIMASECGKDEDGRQHFYAFLFLRCFYDVP